MQQIWTKMIWKCDVDTNALSISPAHPWHWSDPGLLLTFEQSASKTNRKKKTC